MSKYEQINRILHLNWVTDEHISLHFDILSIKVLKSYIKRFY